MNFHPFEVSTPHIIYACLGGFIVLFGMFSLLLRERLYIGEACWAFLFGVIIGPYCANVFDPRSWGGANPDTVNAITLEFTRVVLAIGVFAIGVELPKAYMARHWKSLFYLLFPVMTWGWFVSAGLIFAFIPGLTFLSSLAVAACLTPTDPILAAAVVGGKWADKHVPAHIRHLLAAESGCNDGAAYPFLFIALYLILDQNTGHAIRDWFLLLWIYQVIMGIVIGGLLGFAFRYLMKFCERHDLIDRHSYVAQYVSLAMLTIGLCSLLGSDDLLAAFSCGTAFAWDGFFNRQTEESVFSSVIDLLFNIAAFVFVGAWMPFDKFQDAELTLSVWRLIVIAILILLLKRLPVLVALYKFIPDVKTFREALFTGHFGPVGIGAVFISTLASEILHTGHDNQAVPTNPQTEMLRQTIQPIVAFMVLCSITIHGLSIPGFSLGRRVHSVSRTWSRRDTSDAVPDWTNQIRRVSRPEEVVINRDHDVDLLEKGHLSVTTASPAGELEQRKMTRDSSRTEIHLVDGQMTPTFGSSGRHGKDVERRERRDTDEGSAETKVNRPIGEHLGRNARDDYREENVPDGDDDYVEWIEPHHRIIERRQNGPGSDVDVIVTNEEEGTSSTSHSGSRHPGSHGVVGLLQRGAEKVEGAVKDAEEELKVRFSPTRGGDRETSTTPQPQASSSTTSTKQSELSVPEDDEDGWTSEVSDSSGQLVAGPSSVGSGGGSGERPGTAGSTSGKKRRVFGTGRKSRQRISLRRTLTGGNLGRYTASTTSSSSDADEPRGRTAGLTPPSSRMQEQPHSRSLTPQAIIVSAPPSPSSPPHPSSYQQHNSPRHHSRVENIRLQASRAPTREASPSRSVRFVDESSGDSLTFGGGNGNGNGVGSMRGTRVLDFSPPGPSIGSGGPPSVVRLQSETPVSTPGVEKTESGASVSSSSSLGGGRK